MVVVNLEGHFDEATLLPRSPLTAWQMSPDGPLWTRTKVKLTYLLQRNGSTMSTLHALNLHRLSPNSLLIQIQHASTVANMWKTIVVEFDHKGRMVQVDLCCRMMEKWVSEMDDIRAHLDNMALLHQHLSGMGIAIHDEDYMSMVLMLLPDSYTTHLKTLADAAISSGQTFTALDFIAKAIELSDNVSCKPTATPNQARKTLHSIHSDVWKKTKKGKLI